MESSFRLFRVRGIEIGANWSWILFVAYFVYVLSETVFPSSYPNLGGTSYLVMGVVTAVVFFGTLLLHELGHALRALKEGMEIDGITLWFFGGVARFKGMFPSAGAEFRIAIAGPLVTVVCVVVFTVATWALEQLDAPGQIVGVTDYLAWINGILLGFNLIPALPLDGGRVLRSWLWHRQKNFALATASAAKAGRAFGGVLVGVGLLGLFTGAGFGALPFALVGWFLMLAARAEASFAQVRQALDGLHVRDVMTPDPETVAPGTSIEDFIEELAHARGHSTYPVVEAGKLVGLVSLRLAVQVPGAERAQRTVRDVMVPLERVPTVGPEAEMSEAVEAIQGGPGRAVVVADDRVVGILSGSDIARAIEIERIRGPREAPVAARRTPIIVWILVTAAIVGAGGYLYSPPVVVIEPGQSFDVTSDIEITGRDAVEVNGKYLLTSVSVQQPNALGFAWALLRSEDIVALSTVVPAGADTDRYFEQQRVLFQETQMVAAAAAAKAAGLEVKLEGTGARVGGIVRDSPAAEQLRPGDVITAVDDRPVRLADELGSVIRERPSGTNFKLTVDRAGRELNVDIRSRSGVIEGRPGIGVQVETRDFDIALPFQIRFAEHEIGGPSAGITYALAVYDMLVADDVARGRAIASTGLIDLDGNVGPVGGVQDKGVAAEREGAKLFLVPNDEVDEARGSGLDVRGVATLEEAIRLLRG